MPPPQQGLVPIPDPTVLTTQTILREVASTRELLETRINGMDERYKQLHVEFDRVPGDIVNLVETLKHLHEEKFRSIQVQFVERDTRTEQTSRDSKVAVDAALQAAKEAVEKQNTSSALAIAKSEGSTVKQIDAMGTQMSDMRRALDDKIDDLKQRLTRVEEAKTIVKTVREDTRGNIGMFVAIAAVIVAIIALFVRLKG